MQALIFGNLFIKKKVGALRRRQAVARGCDGFFLPLFAAGQDTFALMQKYPKHQERTMLPRSRLPHGPPFFQSSALSAIKVRSGVRVGTIV